MFFVFSEKRLLNNECVYLIVAEYIVRKKINLRKYTKTKYFAKGQRKVRVVSHNKFNVRVECHGYGE